VTLDSLKRAPALFLLTTAICGLTLTAPAGAQGPDPDRYIVKFTDTGRGKAALAAAGAVVVLDLPEVSAAAARIPAQALQGLSRNPSIEYIEPDVPRYPMAQTTPYGIGMVQADQLSDAAAGNRTVCIIDSGYSLGHEDLPDGGVQGNNDSGAGNWNVDGCGHGTHVAGTIAALNNGAGVVGVLPNEHINLHIVRVFGNSCSWAYSSTLISAANKCRDAGANVISMSLGGGLSSTTERNAFQSLYDAGILSVAAAGNGGNTRKSYPASYDSVISVAAVDSARVAASFSQRNDQVELSAPGVAVRSTVPMGTGTEESLAVGSQTYEVVSMQGSPNATGSGPLVNCGLGTSVCSGAGGRVCLIQRGTNSFAEKVQNCEAGGGVAAVIYNNAEPLFSGTLGGTATGIPSVGASGTTGAVLLGLVGQSATVTIGPGNYAFYDGTSMATPHVSGVAALVWSHNTAWTNQQIREALAATALDLGAAGRDTTYGWGLVQAKAALDFLNGGGGGEPPPPPPPPGGFTLSATARKVKGFNTVNLTWSGATSASVDIYRDGANITTTANDGAHTDSTGTKGGRTFTYKVCEAGTSTCSNSVTVVF
jgi:subtilisin family serine protease